MIGAEECELIDNLIWAREVRKAFDHKLDDTALEAGELLREIPLLPKIGAAEVLLRESETLRAEIAGYLDREDFFAVGADIRNRLQNLNLLVKAGAEQLTGQFTQELNLQRDAIRSTPLWATLPEADRANFSHSTFRNVTARKATLTSADLSGADIGSYDFTEALLDNADLHGATVRDTNLTTASLSAANVSDATLSNLTLSSGSTDHLRVTLTLPSTAGNSLQNKSSTISYV